MREDARVALGRIVGNSPAIVRIRQVIPEVAPYPIPIIIIGETGTGKELIAAAVAACARMQLYTINCAALSENLLESELFGHEKGAFTGADKAREGLLAAARGQVLFLDELEELPPSAQAKLLRVLEYGDYRRLGSDSRSVVQLRIVAATNVDLETAVSNERLRRDLFHRLAGTRIHVPPLRERRDDIPLIASALLRGIPWRTSDMPTRLSDSAGQSLSGMDWPGNVRQLVKLIERIAVVSRGCDMVEAMHVERALRLDVLPSSNGKVLSMDEEIDKVVRRRLLQAISSGGTREAMAASIGRSPAHFYRLLKKHGLTDHRP